MSRALTQAEAARRATELRAAGKTVVTLVLTNLANSSQFVTFNSREAGNGPQLLVG